MLVAPGWCCDGRSCIIDRRFIRLLFRKVLTAWSIPARIAGAAKDALLPVAEEVTEDIRKSGCVVTSIDCNSRRRCADPVIGIVNRSQL